jgi:CSLREA domain-containing protein
MKYYMVWLAVLVPIVVILFLGGFAGSSFIGGVTFVVNSTADVTDVNPGNGVCETAAGNGVCTLRAAVQETNALPGADEIELPAGVYSRTLGAPNEDGAATGDLDISDDLTLVGAGATSTIIDGGQADRVLHVLGSQPVVSIENLTLRNGRAFYDFDLKGGGGIYNAGGSVELENSVVELNDSTGWVGGIRSEGALTLVDSAVVSNTATWGQGGGILNDSGNLIISGGDIRGNRASNGEGGGIYVGGTATIENTWISDNISGFNRGAGIANHGELILTETSILHNSIEGYSQGSGLYNGTTGTVVMTGGAISGNSISAGGGAAGLINDGVANIHHSLISDNDSENWGGAIFNTGALTITFTTVADNTAGGSSGVGGGIYNAGGHLFINHSAFRGNHTRSGGSAIHGSGEITLLNTAVYSNTHQQTNAHTLQIGGSVSLINVTVSGNEGGINSSAITITNSTIADNQGWGIFSLAGEPDIQLKNSIVANNTSGNCFTGVTSNGHNLDSGNTCLLSGPGDLIDTDPLLGPLQDNGGPSWTHALSANSPAIDTADNNGCPVIDQRGAPRPVDGDGDDDPVCDMGAYEYGSEPVEPTPTATPSATATGTGTATPVPSSTATPTTIPSITPTATNTPIASSTPTPTAGPSSTSTPTHTPTLLPSSTPTTTPTVGPPSYKMYLPTIVLTE